MSGQRWTEEDDALLREMIQDGKSDEEIFRREAAPAEIERGGSA
jgi:hypothetical protein